jgi:hypothetical protein
MSELEEIARPVFYSLPLWLVLAFYLLSVAALGVFFYGGYVKLRKYRQGRQEPEERLTLKGIRRAVFPILFNRTVLQRDPYAGLAHLCVFWGFAGLFVATLLVLVENDIVQPLAPQWSFLKGDFYLLFSWLADLCGLLLLVGLLLFMLRRGLFRLPQLRYRAREDAAALAVSVPPCYGRRRGFRRGSAAHSCHSARL